MKIIYEQDDGSVAIMAGKASDEPHLHELAVKLVPANKRFKIVNDSDIPDNEFVDAWRVDFTTNDGTGTRQ